MDDLDYTSGIGAFNAILRRVAATCWAGCHFREMKRLHHLGMVSEARFAIVISNEAGNVKMKLAVQSGWLDVAGDVAGFAGVGDYNFVTVIEQELRS